MIQIGRYTATIVENSVRSNMSGKPYINLLLQIEGEPMECKIWMTDKAIHGGMSQRSLMKCGFDYDKQNLSDLVDKKNFLAGRKIPVSVTEDPQYGLQCQILLDSVDKDQLNKLQDLLRKKKVEEPEGDEFPF